MEEDQLKRAGSGIRSGQLLPEDITAPEDSAVDTNGVGIALFLANTLMPGAALILGVCVLGFDARGAAGDIRELKNRKNDSGQAYANPMLDANPPTVNPMVARSEVDPPIVE
jgi:hypothetical protein